MRNQSCILLSLLGLAIFAEVFFLSNVSFAAQTDILYSPSQPDGDEGWYRSPINITLTATDLESGVGSIHWRTDNTAWESQSFPLVINLAPNPSFEDGLGNTITGWQFAGTNGAVGVRDTTTAKYGVSSAKLTSVTNGWSSFHHPDNYAVVVPSANMTASVWVKTENVSGLGAGLKVYSLSPTGPVLLGSTSSITGTNGWTFISRQFIVTPEDAYGVYLELGLSGTGSVWFDGVNLSTSPTPTQASFTFSQNGSHNLEYYAVNQQGISESPHNFQSLKIDTVSPYNWREFDLTQVGNDHTLTADIKVDDPASGIDSSGGLFQYSVDGGINWGYYSNLTSCSSNWISDGWLSLSTDLENNGKSAELQTPAVDYCNSNWSICKIVRFQARDLAGNGSYKDICINGAWFSVAGGDVFGGGGIDMSAAGGQDNTDGLILATSSVVSNFSSSRNWVISGYEQELIVPNYDSLYSTFSGMSTISVLPKIDGFFQTQADFTVSRNTLPTGLDTANFGAVVFVNGDLIINSNYSLASLGGIIFVVAGDVLVDKSVSEMAGYFITNGLFDTAYNGGGNADPLIVRGGVAAARFSLSRSLRNNDNPAETFQFEPKYYLLLGGSFPVNKVNWREITP